MVFFIFQLIIKMFKPDYKKFELDMKEYFKYTNNISDNVNIKEIWNRCADKYKSKLIDFVTCRAGANELYKLKDYGIDIPENQIQYMRHLYENKKKSVIIKIKMHDIKFIKKFLKAFEEDVRADVIKLNNDVKLDSLYTCPSLYAACSNVLNLNIPADYEYIFLQNIFILPDCVSPYHYDDSHYNGPFDCKPSTRDELFMYIAEIRVEGYFKKGLCATIDEIAKELSYFD